MSNSEKWVYFLTNEGKINLTQDEENLYYLEYEEGDVETKTALQEFEGVDGALPSASSFGAFKLVLRFVYRGSTINDYHLFKERLRRKIYQREAYFVVHSDMPGKKYAVVPESTNIENVYSRNGKFEITFQVIKGYSESLKDTDSFDLLSDDWQFENGLQADDDIKYVHNTRKFKIFNGSTDTISPVPHRHKLIIKMNIDAPNGFTLTNKTTGDVFEYKKKITKSSTLILDDIYPYIKNKRVGTDTNWRFITLAKGYNDFVVDGDNVVVDKISFTFNFVYR